MTVAVHARTAMLQVSPEFLLELCKAGPARFARIVAHPLPADAKLVGVFYDAELRYVNLVVQSESFAEVGPGQARPYLESPTFEVVYQKLPAD